MDQKNSFQSLKGVYRARPRLFWGIFFLFAITPVSYFGALRAPSDSSQEILITIEEGMTLSEVTNFLFDMRIIRYPALFKGLAFIFGGGDDGIIAGDYFFKSPPTVLGVAFRLTSGRYGVELVELTIPEGASVFEISLIAGKLLNEFDSERFLELAKDDEGYLFPDTYLFLPNTKAEEVHRVMRENFNKKIFSLKPAIRRTKKDVHEIITMASLLEEEAKDTETRRLISGVLWKRIDIGMLLQVDATFIYIIGKNTFELTLDDLKIDSPYNTYRYKGLPPGPISNPGIDSIKAAINPEESDYLFYLADLTGETHFSETFEEHKQKKARYLP